MIGREIGREEISTLITDYFLADSFEQQIVLTDVIMDELTSIPLENLTVNKIRETIEREVTVWIRMHSQH